MRIQSYRRVEKESETDKYRTYEAMKAQWVKTHPEATSAEYERAMTLIAKRLGI